MNIKELKDYYADQTTLSLLQELVSLGWNECELVKGINQGGNISDILRKIEVVKEEIVKRTK